MLPSDGQDGSPGRVVPDDGTRPLSGYTVRRGRRTHSLRAPESPRGHSSGRDKNVRQGPTEGDGIARPPAGADASGGILGDSLGIRGGGSTPLNRDSGGRGLKNAGA